MKSLNYLCWCLPLLFPSGVDLRSPVTATIRVGKSHRDVPDKCCLFGRIKVVDSFPDVKIKLVSSFPDIKVKLVSSFPDKPGKWKFVDSFPDFKIKFVDSFPDYTIEYVDNFPSCK
ncbi:MAG: hypothetical protein VX951_02500 [Planctomycetota bacterium]|nr:hypothetical protein [Planctomycetota bacterium]